MKHILIITSLLIAGQVDAKRFRFNESLELFGTFRSGGDRAVHVGNDGAKANTGGEACYEGCVKKITIQARPRFYFEGTERGQKTISLTDFSNRLLAYIDGDTASYKVSVKIVIPVQGVRKEYRVSGGNCRVGGDCFNMQYQRASGSKVWISGYALINDEKIKVPETVFTIIKE